MNSKLSIQLISAVLLGCVLIGCGNLQESTELVFKQTNRAQLLSDAAEAYHADNFSEAGDYYLKILIHNQDDAIVAYNLACCYALQEDAQNAAKFVTLAFQNGFRGLDIFNRDKDFDPVRNDPVFLLAVKDIEKRFESVGKKDYVVAPALQPYRIRFPKNYDASKSYPLLVGMHGRGGNSEGFVSQYDKLEDPQVIYVAPEGQYPLSMNVGPQWYRRSWAITNAGKQALKTSDKLVSAYILNTIKQVSKDYKVSDVYLLGFSQGAAFAYTIGLQNPETIKGVIGFGGYLMDVDKEYSPLTSEDIEAGKDLRIFIAHGIDDTAIKVETAREIKSMFEEKGYDLTYTEFEGRHDIKADIFNRAVSWIQL